MAFANVRPTPAEIAAKQRRKEKTRGRILAAAKTVFFRDGYAANMDAIAEAAEVARTTLFNQFESKEQLFRAVVEDIFTRLLGDLGSVPPEWSLHEALMHYSRRYLLMTFDPESVALSRLALSEVSRFPDLAHLAYSAGYGWAVPPVAAYLSQQMDKGVLVRLDAEQAAERLLAASVGYSRHRLLYQIPEADAEARERYLADTIDIFIRGMRVS